MFARCFDQLLVFRERCWNLTKVFGQWAPTNIGAQMPLQQDVDTTVGTQDAIN